MQPKIQFINDYISFIQALKEAKPDTFYGILPFGWSIIKPIEPKFANRVYYSDIIYKKSKVFFPSFTVDMLNEQFPLAITCPILVNIQKPIEIPFSTVYNQNPLHSLFKFFISHMPGYHIPDFIFECQ